jgi:hypothetical protein
VATDFRYAYIYIIRRCFPEAFDNSNISPHSLMAAAESVTEIEFELDEVKGHYREVIKEGMHEFFVVP